MSSTNLAPIQHPLDPATITLVTDALYRAVLALDTNDLPLWTSAFTTADPQPSFTLFGTTHTGQAALEEHVFRKVNNLDTMHLVSNVRVSGLARSGGGGNGDVTKAKLTAAAQATHYRPGEGPDLAKTDRVVSGSLYELVVAREADGVWRIESWDMKVVWLEGTMDVMASN